ncbi:22906_t:CDS:1, partial [Rhizophagus irregularis]
ACGDILKLLYPNLYSNDTIICPNCHQAEDTNQHLGFGPTMID